MSSFVSVIGILLAGFAGVASAQPAQPRDRAALIDACIKEIRSGLKAGQHMTNQQRMMAEEACRARADAQLQSGGTAPKQ